MPFVRVVRGAKAAVATNWREDVVYGPGVVINLGDDADWREHLARAAAILVDCALRQREQFTFWLGAEVERL